MEDGWHAGVSGCSGVYAPHGLCGIFCGDKGPGKDGRLSGVAGGRCWVGALVLFV